MGQDTWPEIPGLTAVDGALRLPRSPSVVVELLARIAQEEPAPSWAEVAAGAEPERRRGLAGWAQGSRVVGADDRGAILRHPELDLSDLAARFAAYCGSVQVAPEAQVLRDRYVREISRLAVERQQLLGAPTHEGTWPLDVPAAPTEGAGGGARVERLRRVIAALDEAFVERGSIVRLSLLSVLAGQHVLLLGPPGTAKSALARGLCSVVHGATYFEYLLTRFTHPDELFGPISIPALRDEDYRRVTQGFLPTAHLAFLDEVFKASSAILNALLTLVNERRFHHGRHRDEAPLLSLIGASNERPEDDTLAALWDRFLVRVEVAPVADPSSFLRVAVEGVAEVALPEWERLTLEEIAAVRADAVSVEVPAVVRAQLLRLWSEAMDRGWQVSDRRWRQAVGWLRVAAAAEGRPALVPSDLLLLDAVLAPNPDAAAEVRAVLYDVVGGASAGDDLAAQWLLLRVDRVAPVPGDASLGQSAEGLPSRLLRRRRHLQRFRHHLQEEVRRLAEQRDLLSGESGLWRRALGARWLAEHAARVSRLAGFEAACRRYEQDLRDPTTAVASAVDALPGEGRPFGSAAALTLQIVAGSQVLRDVVLVTDDAEVGVRRGPRDARVDGLPGVRLDVSEWEAFATGALEPAALVAGLPAWSRRGAQTALRGVVALLAGSPLPPPPAP